MPGVGLPSISQVIRVIRAPPTIALANAVCDVIAVGMAGDRLQARAGAGRGGLRGW